MDPFFDDLNANQEYIPYFDIDPESFENPAVLSDLEFSEDASAKSDVMESPWLDEQAVKEEEWTRRGSLISEVANFDDAQAMLNAISFGRADSGDNRNRAPESNENYFDILKNPLKNTENLKYRLDVGEFPSRSRVETQIKCRLQISPPPPENLLHLPGDTIARPRFQLRDEFQPQDGILHLDVDAVVPENPTSRVLMCSKCLARERKRAFRKKTLDLHEESHWQEDQVRRVIIFNCRELIAIPPSFRVAGSENGFTDSLVREVDLPLRLACYCRHHLAKNGYKLVFTLRDTSGTVVGRTVSGLIFITDNHKEPRSKQQAQQSEGSDASGFSEMSDSAISSTSQSSSRQRRYHPYTRATPQNFGDGRRTSSVSSDTSQVAIPPSSQMSMFQRLQDSAISDTPSRVIGQSPQIHRVIPGSGSVRGGIEVTFLGQGFHPGLVAVFGDSPAVSTQCWSDSTIIAHSPPAHMAGPVPVNFQGFPQAGNGSVFTYVQDTDSKLVELALQVVGYKMSGRLEDPGDVAQRIVSGDGDDGSGSSQSHTVVDPENLVMRLLEICRAPGRMANLNLRNGEGQTMLHLASFLAWARTCQILLASGARIDVQDVSGYTPLHFASLGGNRSITRLLLSAGADPFQRTHLHQTPGEIADPTVASILPATSNPRAYYRELNSRSCESISSLVSMQDGFLSQPPPYSEKDSSVDFELLSDEEEDEVDEEEENVEVDGDMLDEDESDDDAPDSEAESFEVLKSWGAGPLKQIQNDRMLFAFWIPLLLIAAVSYTASLAAPLREKNAWIAKALNTIDNAISTAQKFMPMPRPQDAAL